MRSIGLTVVAALCAASLGLPVAAQASVDRGGPSAILPAGHTLVARSFPNASSSLVSPSGVFELDVSSLSVVLSESETGPDGVGAGAVTWWQFYAHKRNLGHDRSTLRMQRNGDLVLRAHSGRRIWHSGTHVAGSYLQLENNGNLVIRNSRRAYVWSTHTTATILTAGQTLAPGQTLVNRYRQQFHITPTYLTMRTNGDLRLRWGKRRTWHSGTHSPGAHLLVSKAGRVDIVSRKGTVVWHSPVLRRDPVLEVDQCGVMELESDRGGRTWNPTHRESSCG